RGRAAQHWLERLGGTDWRRLRGGTLDEERHFSSAGIGEAQILQRRPQGVECRWRQGDPDESWRGNLNQLALLPIAERRGKRIAANEACEQQPRNVTAPAAEGFCFHQAWQQGK